MTEEKLSSIFGRFVGEEMKVIERPVLPPGPVSRSHFELDQSDPVASAMKSAAENNGLFLRVSFPGTLPTRDFRMNRVNVKVERDGDGKWRVQPGFGIG